MHVNIRIFLRVPSRSLWQPLSGLAGPRGVWQLVLWAGHPLASQTFPNFMDKPSGKVWLDKLTQHTFRYGGLGHWRCEGQDIACAQPAGISGAHGSSDSKAAESGAWAQLGDSPAVPAALPTSDVNSTISDSHASFAECMTPAHAVKMCFSDANRQCHNLWAQKWVSYLRHGVWFWCLKRGPIWEEVIPAITREVLSGVWDAGTGAAAQSVWPEECREFSV